MTTGILGAGFNANEVEPSAGFDAIPAGKYRAVIAETEEKRTKKGDGSYLQITFVVTDGEFQNRKLWARLNLNNPNDQAVAIARAELSALCRAVNVMEITSPDQLHDLPVVIKVTAKPDKETKELRNEIRGYEPIGAKIGAAARPPVEAGSKPAWKK